MWAQEQQFPWISELSLYPSLCICTWANGAAAVTRGQGQRRGTHNANSLTRTWPRAATHWEIPHSRYHHHFLMKPGSLAAVWSRLKAVTPSNIGNTTFIHFFIHIFQGQKRFFFSSLPYILWTWQMPKVRGSTFRRNPHLKFWIYEMPHYIFQKLACKNSHIPTKCQVRSLHSTCPNSPSQLTWCIVHHSLLSTVDLQSSVLSTPQEADFSSEWTIFQFDKFINPLGIPPNGKHYVDTSCHCIKFNMAICGARCYQCARAGHRTREIWLAWLCSSLFLIWTATSQNISIQSLLMFLLWGIYLSC